MKTHVLMRTVYMGIAFFLMSCSGKQISPSSLPEAITAYISANYPNTTIVKVEKYANEYEVKLSNGIKLEFNLDGSFKEISGSRKGVIAGETAS